MTDWAERLAKESIKHFGTEGTFAISFAGQNHETLKAAFEALGCTVDTDLHKGHLTITCPEGGAAR